MTPSSAMRTGQSVAAAFKLSLGPAFTGYPFVVNPLVLVGKARQKFLCMIDCNAKLTTELIGQRKQQQYKRLLVF